MFEPETVVGTAACVAVADGVFQRVVSNRAYPAVLAPPTPMSGATLHQPQREAQGLSSWIAPPCIGIRTARS